MITVLPKDSHPTLLDPDLMPFPKTFFRQLTLKQRQLLEFIWTNRNKTVSPQDLFFAVWGYPRSTVTNTLASHICGLRRVIISHLGFDPIENVKAKGYCLKF